MLEKLPLAAMLSETKGLGNQPSTRLRNCPQKRKGTLAITPILRHRSAVHRIHAVVSGCSSGVEHNLAKVGVVGSNPIARSRFSLSKQRVIFPAGLFFGTPYAE